MDRGGWSGVEPRDFCVYAEDMEVLKVLVLQAGRAGCGTPSQLCLVWQVV
jgi:hypothetical protein